MGKLMKVRQIKDTMNPKINENNEKPALLS